MSRGVAIQRRTAGAGAIVAGLAAAWSLIAGVTGNWIADLGLPAGIDYPWVRFSLFGLAALLTVALAVLALRRPRRDVREDPTTGAQIVAVVPADGSADRRYSIWDMGEFTPDRATVHTAIGRRHPREVDELEPEGLPPYVQRDHDTALTSDVRAAAAGDLHALILLRGGSSTGKTRSLYRAVHEECSGFQVIRPHTPAALRALPGSGHLTRGPTVLWLNELQGFLGSNGTGLTRSLLADLYAATDHPLVVVGTLWPEKLHAGTDPRDEQTRDTRELLTERVPEVRWHPVPDRFSPAEITRAEALPPTDERIVRALADRDRFGFTQTLAGAHELLRFYETATPRTAGAPSTRLVLEAAADARRLGVQSALPAALLEAVATALWREARGETATPQGWFELTLNHASTPLGSDEGVRALIPLAEPAGTYDLADYLEQHLTRARRTRTVRDPVWEAFCQQAPTTSLLRLADQAQARGRLSIERRLIDRAIAAGEPGARSALAFWLEWQGAAPDETEQAWRDAITAGEPDAHRDLALWLDRQGRTDETEQAWRDAITAREPDAHRDLALSLNEQGRTDETEQAWRDAATAGEPGARSDLALWLDEQGRTDEAEQAWRDAITAREPDAHRGLALYLDRQGRTDEIEQAWRDAITAREPGAHRGLALYLDRQGRTDEIEQAWRDAITAREPGAHRGLAFCLEWQGAAPDEAEQVWRDAITGDEPGARSDLALWLSRQGRTDEAEQVWRDAITAGEPDARSALALWLDDRGRTEEARTVQSVGLDEDGQTVVAERPRDRSAVSDIG